MDDKIRLSPTIVYFFVFHSGVITQEGPPALHHKSHTRYLRLRAPAQEQKARNLALLSNSSSEAETQTPDSKIA